MSTRTAADHLIGALAAAGVRRVFGLVGDSLNPIVDAVRRHPDIEWVHCHNEESAALAAGAEAQLTGNLAVCAASCGPGNTHLIQGLYQAHRDRVPVLAIAAHIPTDNIGTNFFQETHPDRVFTDCSTFCEVASNAEQMLHLARIAIQSAVGLSSVSVLIVPGDVAHQSPSRGSISAPLPPGPRSQSRGRVVPAAAGVRQLARAINQADTVTIFAGAGVQDARAHVLALADKLKAPVAHTLAGKEWIQYDNPFDVGMTGLLGYGAAYDAMHEADLLIMLGTDFPYSTFLPTTSVAQIDHNAANLGRRTVVEHAIHGDVGATLDELLSLVEPKEDAAFLERKLRDHERALTRVVDAYTRNIEHLTPIHPEYVASQIDELSSDDAVFTVDTGMNNVWAARYLTPNGRRRIIGSWRHGTMANALPQSIGAQTAFPDRQVVCLSGDGGLAMLLGELLTVSRQRLPIKVIVFNNSSLGMVKLEMLVDGLPDHGTDHEPADYAAIAAGAGIWSRRVTDPALVTDAIRDLFAQPGPALLDVVTDPNAMSLPPHLELKQLQGFALAAAKTVLGGGVGKMLDVARSNLRNIPRP